MKDEITSKAIVDRKTNEVYINIDTIITWLYTAEVNNKIVEDFLTDISLILQIKKEEALASYKKQNNE